MQITFPSECTQFDEIINEYFNEICNMNRLNRIVYIMIRLNDSIKIYLYKGVSTYIFIEEIIPCTRAVNSFYICIITKQYVSIIFSWFHILSGRFIIPSRDFFFFSIRSFQNCCIKFHSILISDIFRER